MNQILSIILIVGCVNISFGQPVVLQNKLYLLDNKVYIPKILEERAALINYFNVDKEYVEEKNEYVLMFSVSDVFSTKIKYCLLGDTVLIALSAWKVIYDEKIIHALPMFVAIPIKSIEPITESSIRDFVIKRKGATLPYLEYSNDFSDEPVKDYTFTKDYGFHYRARGPIRIETKKYYHDFYATKEGFGLVYLKESESQLKIYEYPVMDSMPIVEQKIEPKLVAVYPWTEQGNFYTFYVNQQCYLFMESGEMYHLSKEAEKIGILGKNLVDYSILHDQDQDKLFVIAKKHLEEQIPFSALLEKYGEEIKLKSK